MDLTNPYDNRPNFNEISNNLTSAKAIAAEQGNIHIRMQQRNGRKCITTIQGLASDLDIAKITRALKKTYQCNGSIKNDPEAGEVIQLSGDQRTNVRRFFIDEEVCYEDQIVVH